MLIFFIANCTRFGVSGPARQKFSVRSTLNGERVKSLLHFLCKFLIVLFNISAIRNLCSSSAPCACSRLFAAVRGWFLFTLPE